MDHKGLGRLFRSQHGVISRSQAIELGLSEDQIDRRVATGFWIRMSPGIYTYEAAVPTWARQLSAAHLSQPSSLVAGRSAARLLGFDGIGPGRPELLVPFTGNARSTLARVIRSRHFESVERVLKRGFPCTSPAETILTMSMTHSPGFIERAIDSELAKNRLEIQAFSPILDRLAYARQPGLPALRRIAAGRSSDGYQPPTSELERLLYTMLNQPQVPSYERQMPIQYPKLKATVDAYIPEWRTVVEADGRRWHTRKEHFEIDRERDNAAAAAGLVVVRFTWKNLRYDPRESLKTLLAVGKQRTAA